MTEPCVPLAPGALEPDGSSAASDEEIARFARALGHPARVRILRLLAVQPNCIGGDLVAGLDLAQSTVSEHVRILKEAGLVTAEADRPRVCYRLNRPALDRARALLAGL